MTKLATPRTPLAGAEENVRLIKTFSPLEWQVDPWNDTSPILLLTGSGGGGKSRIAAEKVHAFCLRYPGTTALILRKIRSAMSNSTILFLKREVIGPDPRVRQRPNDFRFEYNNGSVLAYGGMRDEDQREMIRSIGQKGGLDICWMEEATQFDEEDFNEVLVRMRGTAAPWRQVILSTNPDAPAHWINVRLILGGEASVYYSKATHNFYNPTDYQDSLAKLTGVQHRRLVRGEWASGAGKVVDTWEDEYNPKDGNAHGGNIRLDAEYIPGGGSVIWSVDDGYSGKRDRNTGMFTNKSHPRAFILAQERADGQLAVFAEHLEVGMLAGDHIRAVMQMCRENGWPEKPVFVVRDRAAASLGGALQEFGLRVKYNQVPVDESLKEMREWSAADENGWRRLIAHPRCFHLRYQMQTYSMDEMGRIIKDHDDTVDSLRYLVWHSIYGVRSGVDVATIYDI